MQVSIGSKIAPDHAKAQEQQLAARLAQELPFMNAMREFDSRNGDGRIVERLETGHRGAAPFDRAMVLFNNNCSGIGYSSLKRTSTSDPPAAEAEGPDGSA